MRFAFRAKSRVAFLNDTKMVEQDREQNIFIFHKKENVFLYVSLFPALETVPKDTFQITEVWPCQLHIRVTQFLCYDSSLSGSDLKTFMYHF